MSLYFTGEHEWIRVEDGIATAQVDGFPRQ